MIFACPSCSASHFKPDAEAKAGVTVTCRRCKTKFRVTAAGVEALPAEAQAPTQESGRPEPSGPTAQEAEATVTEPAKSGGFEGARTSIMSTVPQAINAGGLADALEPEIADADMLETIEPSEILADAPIDSGEPSAADSSNDSEVPSAAVNAVSGSPVAALLEHEPTASDVAPTAMDGPDNIVNEAAAEFAGPTELLQGPQLAILQAESSNGEDVGAEAAIAESAGGAEFPHAFESAEGEGDASGTRIDYEMAAFTAQAQQAEPASVSAQQRSKAESESGAGIFEPIAALPRERKRSSGDRVPDFPRGAMRAYMRDLGRYFTNGSPTRKAAILTVLALPIALVILLIISLNKPEPAHLQWVTAPAAMWSGPAAQRGYAQVDTLVRGEEVTALDQVWGEYTLVRDIWGRVGYVNRESLTDEHPSVTPESAFPGCRQAPIETDKEPCEARARSLHDACAATCASDGRCLQRCQDRFTECIDGCKTRLTVPAPAVATVTEPSETAVPPTAVPAEEANEVADPSEAKAVAAERPAKPARVNKPSHAAKKATSVRKPVQASPLKRH